MAASRSTTDEQLDEQRAAYNEKWRSGLDARKEQRGNHRTNLEFLARIDLLAPGDRILEIGCGVGAVVNELSERGHDIIGTDISQVAIEYGLSKYPGLQLEVKPAEALEYANRSFDAVLSFDLFEHIARIDQHIREVARVLVPAGYYLFQTPNKLSNATYETISHRSLEWRRYHPSLHTPRQIRRRLAEHGFETRFVKMNPVNEYMSAKLAKFGPVGSLVKLINFEKVPLILQTNLYVIARKTRRA